MNALGDTKQAKATVPPVRVSLRRMTMRRRETLTAFFSLAPAFLLMAVLIWYPLATAVYHSFTQWDGLQTMWIGLQNY
ncbi:MAG: sugar ABC transporter permease, partial [Chloroflexi bacterium]|nr:sugar ABC transporter permease [Chloroflexota bacterium]